MRIVISRRAATGLLGWLFASLGLIQRKEERLLHRARGGDHEAFDALRSQHERAVHSFLRRRVDISEVEDISQDTWLDAWQALPKMDHRGKFRAWVLTIAFRRVQDHYRTHHRRSALLGSAVLERSYEERDFQRIELQSALSEFWETRTADQRELLTLIYADGLSLTEAAKVTGKNLNTLKYQLYKVHSEGLKALSPQVDAPVSREARAQ